MGKMKIIFQIKNNKDFILNEKTKILVLLKFAQLFTNNFINLQY
jgi:hypothetical protein